MGHNKRDVDGRRSLQELEQWDWGEPTYDSGLVIKVHRLRRKPLAEFANEDLRLLIGQQVGLRYLVPLAVETLEQDPLAQGDLYPGGLLQAVARIDWEFWSYHLDSFHRMRAVIERVRALLPSLEEYDRETVVEALAGACPELTREQPEPPAMPARARKKRRRRVNAHW